MLTNVGAWQIDSGQVRVASQRRENGVHVCSADVHIIQRKSAELVFKREHHAHLV